MQGSEEEGEGGRRRTGTALPLNFFFVVVPAARQKRKTNGGV